jgi:hypothetical protein
MTSKHRHLIATLGLTALALLCFGLLTWALVEGAVIETFSDSGRGRSSTYFYYEVRTREDSPGYFWGIVGLIFFWGTLFTLVAALEYRSYRTYRDSREGETSRQHLMTKIDHACKLYPEGRGTLLRAKTALLELNSPEVEAPLHNLLEKVLRTPDREAALKEIKGLAKAMDLYGKL